MFHFRLPNHKLFFLRKILLYSSHRYWAKSPVLIQIGCGVAAVTAPLGNCYACEMASLTLRVIVCVSCRQCLVTSLRRASNLLSGIYARFRYNFPWTESTATVNKINSYVCVCFSGCGHWATMPRIIPYRTYYCSYFYFLLLFVCKTSFVHS